MQAQIGWPQSGFNPFPVTKGNADPVVKELARFAQSDAQSQFSTPSETQGNVDMTQFKKASGQSAYDRWLELSGYGLREVFHQRMQSHSYVNGSDGSSWYSASSRANMLREIQHRFQDRAIYKFAGSLLSWMQFSERTKKTGSTRRSGRHRATRWKRFSI